MNAHQIQLRDDRTAGCGPVLSRVPTGDDQGSTAELKLDSADREVHVDWRVDLLIPVEEAVGHLATEMESSSYLNAYLLAVAVQQVVDDYLAPVSMVDRARDYVAGHPSKAAGIIGRGLASTGRAAHGIKAARRGRHGLMTWKRIVDDLVTGLAAAVMGPGLSPDVDPVGFSGDAVPVGVLRADATHGHLRALLQPVVAAVPSLPVVVRETTSVLPSCFQTFDLGLDDVRRLAELVATSLGRGAEPVTIVGVRTSGSYLAPLIGAVLEARGFVAVSTITLRPGVPLQRRAAERVHKAVRRHARFVVTDDPPASGSSLARAVEELTRVGVAVESVTVAYPRFTDTASELRYLDKYHQVVLPWADWSVHRRLTPDAVKSDLRAILGSGVPVDSVETVESRRLSRSEAHVRHRFRVQLGATSEFPAETLDLAVQGVGIGYYGEHVEVVGKLLGPYMPLVLGLRSGLLYREWLDDAQRLDHGALGDAVPTALAAYVAERRDRLPSGRDRSRNLPGFRPVWETAAVEISGGFGRAWPVVQLLVVNRVVRRILQVPVPVVVDGATELENWFVGEDTAGTLRVRSVGMQRRAYWHHGLSSYDPAFDLAGAMNAELDVPFSAPMLAHYGSLTGDRVSPERWMLLRLAHLWGCRRRRADPALVRAAGARVLQDYFAEVFLPGIAAPAVDGPVCALDIDGVLESNHLGFASLTPSSAFALRALRLHGFRPVLVTGRSVEDVRERCHAYGLVGGVAEYGSALYVAGADEVRDLVPAGAHRALLTLRANLASVPGVVVDPHYRFGVRAWIERAGHPHALPSEAIASVLEGVAGLRVIPGEGQTDFVADAVDKGTGLEQLMAALTVPGAPGSAHTVALAVGDSASDAAMLALADCRSVPAHAASVLDGPGVWRAPTPYQSGLEQAVDRFLGHGVPAGRSNLTHRSPRAPGSALRGALGAAVARTAGRPVTRRGCKICRMGEVDRDREALLALLSATEGGLRGMPGRAVRAMVTSLRPGRM